jgi:hypothetical protein
VVWKLDRLARSLKKLIATAEELDERGVGLVSLRPWCMDPLVGAAELGDVGKRLSASYKQEWATPRFLHFAPIRAHSRWSRIPSLS